MLAETSAHHPVNHVFVDLENVKRIEASVLNDKHVRLHLFLGPQNKKLDVDVVEKLLEHAQAVQMVRSPKAGKNALDFVLAYHLGQAAQTDPKGYFHIVSKDTGFDALVELLKSRQVKVRRHNNWSALNLSSAPKTAAAGTKEAGNSALSEDAEKLLENLKKSPKNRPKKEQTLTAHAVNFTGKDKPDAEDKARRVIEELKKAKRIAVDEKGAVSYQV